MRLRTGFLMVLLGLLAWPAVAQFGAGPTLEHKVLLESQAAHAGAPLRVLFQFSLDAGWHVNSHTPLEDFLVPTALTLPESGDIVAERVVYPEHEVIALKFSPEPLAVYEHDFTIGAVLRPSDSLAPGTYTLEASLRYQACNDTQCMPPKTITLSVPVEIVGAEAPLAPQHAEAFSAFAWDGTHGGAAPEAGDTTAEGAANPATDGDWRALADQYEIAGTTAFVPLDEFLAFVERAEAGEAKDDNYLARLGWWLVIPAVFFGGLLLNLTPCVLPLIPINIAIIGAGARAGSRLRGFALGGVYGLGIAAVYGGLGLVVVLGLSSTFGSINSTVWFNGGIAALFVVLGLAMFDLITIDFSKWQAKIGPRNNKGGSFAVAAVMGAVSALLAGACVAPVVIYTIIYAQDQYAAGYSIALALPFVLGLGMAFPWPFAGASLSFLPKPGAWMVRVKQAFGVFILGFAVWYGWTAWDLAQSRYFGGDVAAQESEAEDGWYRDLAEGLRVAVAEQRPVLIDFWAIWCKNCHIMDAQVFKSDRFAEAMDEYVLIKYQAEEPEVSPAREVLDYFEGRGLPHVVVLLPKGA